MNRPSVNVAVMNGQLKIVGPSEFGTCMVAIATPAAPTAGYGTAFVISSKSEAKAAFADVANVNVLRAIVEGFYGQAAEGNLLYVICMAQTTTLTTLADAMNAEKALNLGAGNIRLASFIKFPSNTYTPTVTNGFDADVHTALAAAKTLSASWLAKNKPFRALIQGYANSGVYADATDYSTATGGTAGICAFEIAGDSAFATLALMGKKVSVAPQQNAGRVKSGSLNLDSSYAVTVGGANVNTIDPAVLNGYYTKRYITAEPNQDAAGYIITDDIMACNPTDDYFSLENGMVIDNLVRVAFKTYYKELKDDIDVDENGRIAAVEEKYLESAIVDAADRELKTQFSVKQRGGIIDVDVMVNPDTTKYAALYAANNIQNPNTNLLSGGTLYIFIKARPKGCARQINLYLGFSN